MSELALQLIAENKKTKSPFLDLGNCGLTELPAEISELTWLKTLVLSNVWHTENEQAPESYNIASSSGFLTWYRTNNNGELNKGLADLSPIEPLENLESLFVAGSRVKTLESVRNMINLRVLDISNTRIKSIKWLAKCGGMAHLHMSGVNIASIEVVGRFLGLKYLNISHSMVEDLSPLSWTRNLNVLIADITPVKEIHALQKLQKLKCLDLSSSDVFDFRSITWLKELEVCRLAITHFRDAELLSGLSQLQELDISNTEVSDIGALNNLTALRYVDLSGSAVRDISALLPLIDRGAEVGDWALNEWQDKYGFIYVRHCELINPPLEIAYQGRDAVLNYFAERNANEQDQIYEAKMLIIGDGGAGKTSLLRRLYQPDQPLPLEEETTKGIAVYRHEFDLKNGRRFRLNVWDFGGQEIYHATHQFFLTRRSLYLLLDDTRHDHKTVSDPYFQYWLPMIDMAGGHSPTLIFQNEKGGRSKQIDLAGIKGRFDNVKDCYSGDLSLCGAADQLRAAIELHAAQLPHIGETLPAGWVRVREEIEQYAQQQPYISQQVYFEIYGRHLPFDRSKALWLSQYLHDLGVFLHFQDDPLLARILVLQSGWATEAVFKVLDDEEIKARGGRFSRADCQRLWSDPKYQDMQPELLQLMQRFELCYALPDSQPASWLLPQLLPASRPLALVETAGGLQLVRRYRYEFMPKGLINRLTVRQHRFVLKPELAWASGVQFQHEGAYVLAFLLANGREIELRAHGPDRKTLLQVIASDLDALNISFPGLQDKVEQLIPCPCTKCKSLAKPHFFEYKKLLTRRDRGKATVECEESYTELQVQDLLDGIKPGRTPAWAKPQPASGQQRKLRIFLASSAELRDDRDAFDLFVRQLNDRLVEQDRYLQVTRWEHFLDAMSETRLQDEYNRAVRDCDVFVSLFKTKVGKYTEEEFEVAHAQFKQEGQPRIYTYFSNQAVNLGALGPEFQSLLAFKNKLDQLGHFYTQYDNLDQLKLKFREQLDLLWDA